MGNERKDHQALLVRVDEKMNNPSIKMPLKRVGERRWTDGKLRYETPHRRNGPAIESDNGKKTWYTHGKMDRWDPGYDWFYFNDD